jgi:uncharacterized damage-inducible protein DinB
MSTIESFLKEIDQEAIITRKMLERIPADKYDWRPHEKSMSVHQLSGHIAELPDWIKMGMTTDGLDFAATPYTPPVWNTNEELLAIFEQSLKGGRAAVAAATGEDLTPIWTLRNGDQVYMQLTKGELIRHSLSQIIHHRAQLGVFLRLLDIPIPGSYGPSADDQGF